jgi:hypothetical protein
MWWLTQTSGYWYLRVTMIRINIYPLGKKPTKPTNTTLPQLGPTVLAIGCDTIWCLAAANQARRRPYNFPSDGQPSNATTSSSSCSCAVLATRCLTPVRTWPPLPHFGKNASHVVAVEPRQIWTSSLRPHTQGTHIEAHRLALTPPFSIFYSSGMAHIFCTLITHKGTAREWRELQPR